MIVEIDLFSGRPNPRWQADDGVRREVLEIEARLKVAVSAVMELPGLGYRGFVYEDGGATRRAFGGVVEIENTMLDDPDCVIERLLLTSMPPELSRLRERATGLLP